MKRYMNAFSAIGIAGKELFPLPGKEQEGYWLPITLV